MGRADPYDASITQLDVVDVRFPTSRALDGSDAMDPDPDDSAASVDLRPDRPSAPAGHATPRREAAG